MNRARVNRSSAQWKRIRAACCQHSSGAIDLDAHADGVWLLINNNGRSGSPSRASAAAASQERV